MASAPPAQQLHVHFIHGDAADSFATYSAFAALMTRTRSFSASAAPPGKNPANFVSKKRLLNVVSPRLKISRPGAGPRRFGFSWLARPNPGQRRAERPSLGFGPRRGGRGKAAPRSSEPAGCAGARENNWPQKRNESRDSANQGRRPIAKDRHFIGSTGSPEIESPKFPGRPGSRGKQKCRFWERTFNPGTLFLNAPPFSWRRSFCFTSFWNLDERIDETFCLGNFRQFFERFPG